MSHFRSTYKDLCLTLIWLEEHLGFWWIETQWEHIKNNPFPKKKPYSVPQDKEEWEKFPVLTENNLSYNGRPTMTHACGSAGEKYLAMSKLEKNGTITKIHRHQQVIRHPEESWLSSLLQAGPWLEFVPNIIFCLRVKSFLTYAYWYIAMQIVLFLEHKIPTIFSQAQQNIPSTGVVMQKIWWSSIQFSETQNISSMPCKLAMMESVHKQQ